MLKVQKYVFIGDNRTPFNNLTKLLTIMAADGTLAPKFVVSGSFTRQFDNWLNQKFAELPLGGQFLEIKSMFPLQRITSL